MNTKERNVSLDITRIIAVLAVIMIHTSSNFVVAYDYPSLEFMMGNLLDSMARIGVPLFIMISGSLMLDENKCICVNDIFFKYIKNIVILMIFWSVFYCSIYDVAVPLLKGEAISLEDVIVPLVTGHGHMWYLYMLVGLYLATPFLREFVKRENKQLVLLFIVISLITQFTMPMLDGVSLIREEMVYIIKFIRMFQLGFFNGFITYYLIGWYIIHIGIKKEWRIYCLGIISLVLIMLYVQFTKDESNAYSNMNILVLAYSVAVFLTLNRNPEREVSIRTRKILELLSKLSFGVYIIHPLFQSVIHKLFPYTEKPILYNLFYFGIVSILSFGGCYVARKLPVIRKFIRM